MSLPSLPMMMSSPEVPVRVALPAVAPGTTAPGFCVAASAHGEMGIGSPTGGTWAAAIPAPPRTAVSAAAVRDFASILLLLDCARRPFVDLCVSSHDRRHAVVFPAG